MKNKILKKMTAFFVCVTLVLSIIPPANSAWDGYPKPETGENIVLVDNNNISNIIAAKGKPSTKNVKKGERFSAHWDDHATTTYINYTDVERDWSMCNTISFDVYSEKATNAKIVLIVQTDLVPTPGKTISYLSSSFKLDFEGWKTITLNTATDFTVTNYGDWEKVQSVRFVGDGWGAAAHPESDIYISSVYGAIGEASEAEDGIERMELSDKEKQAVFAALGTGTAIMNFAGNAVRNGQIIPLDVADRITTDESGGSIAPLTFFENALGAQVSNEDGKTSITLDNDTVDLTDMVKVYDGVSYLPLDVTFSALGKTSESFDMVTVIGEAGKINSVKNDASILKNLKIMLNANALSKDDVTKEDWKFLKDKWRKQILGDSDKNLEDKNMAEWIKSIDNSAMGAQKQMIKDNNVLSLFTNKGATTTKEMTNEYAKINTMAKAYGTYGCKNYRNPQLRRDILYALDWMYENFYGQDIIDGKGWKSIYDYDWWDWHVGVPTQLGEILLIMENDMTPKLVNKYLEPFEFVRKNLRTGLNTAHAASRVYACTLSSALREDFESMKDMVVDYNLMLVPPGHTAGVQEDWLYITHEYYAYSAAYGSKALLERFMTVESVLGGTVFEFATPYKYLSCQWLYETFAPIMFNGAITSAQSGRFRADNSFSETTYISYAIAAMLDFIGVFGKDDDIKLKQIIKRNIIDANKSAIISRLEIDQKAKLLEILADSSIPEEPYYKSHVYYTGDSVVHQMDDYGFALSMSSTRIAGWESIGGQNTKGWYQGDGMLFTYVDEDPNAYNLNYWKNVNPYHMPGTTIDTQERVSASILDSAMALSKQDFVGGVNLDGLYSMAAMQLQTHNCDNENPNVSEAAPGSDAPFHKSSLMAKKAYFMFDDEAVALGSDINADDGFEVQTVVENRRLNKTEKIVKETGASEKKAYDLVSVTSSSDDGNVVQNTLDNNYDTRWSASGDAYAIYELSEPMPIGYVGIAQYNGTNGKQAIFELETSLDGENWTKIWEGKASGTTPSMEAYDMKGTVAKYVKYSGHGRTSSEWNSLTEVKIFAPTKDGSMPVDGEVTDDRILGTEKITVDGTLMEKVSNYKKSFKNPTWVHLEGTGGYFFPQGGELEMDKVTNSENFLEMWLSHGVSPKKSTYSYIVLPKKTAEETAAYAKDSDIEILSNTEKLQAVREKTLNITGMVFWQTGTFENITVSQPMMVMTKNQGSEYKVNISDPSQLLTEGKVTILGNYELLECDERLSVVSDGEKTEITINFEGSRGRTLPVILKVK